MNNALHSLAFAAVLLTCPLSYTANLEPDLESLTGLILRQDGLFWNAYNTCATERIEDFFTADVEFYHDKGGITLGAAALKESIEKNICGGGSKVRRQAVAGTEKVFPLQKDNQIYGAILSGEHLFYLTEKGKDEYLTGRARFTHLWLKKAGEFKMARVLSYDHQPVPSERNGVEIKLSHEQLERFAATYQGPVSGKTTVKREGDLLVLQGGKSRYLLYPQTENTFFLKERDVTFEFQDKAGKPFRLVVREKGAVAEEALVEP